MANPLTAGSLGLSESDNFQTSHVLPSTRYILEKKRRRKKNDCKGRSSTVFMRTYYVPDIILGAGATMGNLQLLGRLRWEDCLSPGGPGCSEPRLCHCTPVWATDAV
nr:uncharacterized protein LOC129467571 [Symphalangus syndactylus]